MKEKIILIDVLQLLANYDQQKRPPFGGLKSLIK